MCFLGGLKIWWRCGGKFIVVFQWFPHAIVCTKKGVLHYTNKRTGKWRVERIHDKAFCDWLLNKRKGSKV